MFVRDAYIHKHSFIHIYQKLIPVSREIARNNSIHRFVLCSWRIHANVRICIGFKFIVSVDNDYDDDDGIDVVRSPDLCGVFSISGRSGTHLRVRSHKVNSLNSFKCFLITFFKKNFSIDFFIGINVFIQLI